MATTDNQDSNRGDGAFVAANEMAGLLETAHLLRSPANAEHLLRALSRAQEQTLSHTWLKRRSDLLENHTSCSFASLFDSLERSEPAQGHDWP